MAKPNFDNIIKDNHDLILKQAQSFKKYNPYIIADLDDYYQEAVIATMMAYMKYDPTKGPWENYVTTVIKNALIKVTTENNSQLSTNNDALKLCTKIYELENQNKEIDQICEELSISRDRYFEVKSLLTKDVLSENVVYKHEPVLDFLDLEEKLGKTEKILFSLYSEEYTVSEIAEHMNWSYEWTRLNVQKLLEKIKNIYNT